MPVLAAIAGAAVTGAFSYTSAQQQMDYQSDMSGTAHQREVADLKAAGLNPILSAKYGGASTPQGAGFQIPDISQVLNSAQAIKNMKKDIEVKDADIYQKTTAGLLNDMQYVVARNLADLHKQQEHKTFFEGMKTYYDAQTSEKNALVSNMVYEFYRDNPWAVGIKEGIPTASSAAGIAKTFTDMFKKGGKTDGRQRSTRPGYKK